MKTDKVIVWVVILMFLLEFWWLVYKNFIKSNEG
jgi:hypothetical protein